MKAIYKLRILTSILLASTIIQYSCTEEELCEALALADLTIPFVVDLVDQLGNPIINPNTGQPLRASNELYYNRRTGEYFNSDFPPLAGLQVGDIIDIATNIFNDFSDSNCKTGKTAGPSITGPELSVTGPFFDGVVPLQGMHTPTIPQNFRSTTVTTFNLATPGTYKVNFNANTPRNIEEHSYANNLYTGQNGTYNGRHNVSFYVEASKSYKKTYVKTEDFIRRDLAPKSVKDVMNTPIYEFMNSSQYALWYITKLKATL